MQAGGQCPGVTWPKQWLENVWSFCHSRSCCPSAFTEGLQGSNLIQCWAMCGATSGVLHRAGNDWLWVMEARMEELRENPPPVLNDRYDWTAPANKAEPLPATGLKVGFKVTSIKDGDCLAVSVGEGQRCWINWSETILNYYERSCRSLFWFRPNWF